MTICGILPLTVSPILMSNIWVYNDEAEMKDTEMIAGMQGNLDTQLIFVSTCLSFLNAHSLNRLVYSQV